MLHYPALPIVWTVCRTKCVIGYTFQDILVSVLCVYSVPELRAMFSLVSHFDRPAPALYPDVGMHQRGRNSAEPVSAPQLVVPKAAKADIWRLAITLRYGGIYADSDVKPVHPFRETVWPNASAVSGLGGGRDLHQWCVSVLAALPRDGLPRIARSAFVALQIGSAQGNGCLGCGATRRPLLMLGSLTGTA